LSNEDALTKKVVVRRKRRRRRRRMVLATIILLPLIYVVYMALLARPANTSGYPETIEELNAYYESVPAEENAAPLYEKAFAVQSGTFDYATDLDTWKHNNDRSDVKFEDALPEGFLDFLRNMLAENNEALDLLHQAAARKGCRFTIDLGQSDVNLILHPNVKSLNQYMDGFQQSGELLRVQARIAAETGDADAAVSAILAALAIPRALAPIPDIGAQGQRNRQAYASTYHVEIILNRMQLTDDALSALQAVVADLEQPEAFTRGIIGARCQGLACFDDPNYARGFRLVGVFTESFVREISPIDSDIVFNKAYRWSGFRNMDRNAFLDITDYAIAASRMPIHEAIRIKDFDKFMSWRSPITRMITPSIEPFFKEQAAVAARIRLTSAALAIERYRLAHGQLPESLAALVPEFLPQSLNDPFDGNPLRYTMTEAGYTLYSIGPDQNDDGGKTPLTRGGGDIIFSMERQ